MGGKAESVELSGGIRRNMKPVAIFIFEHGVMLALTVLKNKNGHRLHIPPNSRRNYGCSQPIEVDLTKNSCVQSLP